jgi:SAM-dependent methyltransferase
LIPAGAKVLDVGCGDGLLSAMIARERPDITLQGIDVLVRQGAHIAVREFDGENIPFEDGAYDVVLLVDVLHHATEPKVLLSEASRVARDCLVIKDHTRNGPFADATLRFMDTMGNARHGVALPFNYWSRCEWDECFGSLKMNVRFWNSRLRLYPFWLDWAFGRSLHFVSVLGLTKCAASRE